MLVHKPFDWYVVLYDTWPQATAAAVIAAGVVVLDVLYDRAGLSVPSAYVALLGTAIAILLAFKNNSAYERWWEARILWGAIVNDSRTFARQVMTLGGEGLAGQVLPWQRRVILRQIAYVNALRLHLRGDYDIRAVTEALELDERSAYGQAPNVPAALLYVQSRDAAEARTAGHLDGFGQMLVEQTIARLTDSLGSCERIKRTPFPRQYDDYAQVIVWAFCLIFPFSLVQELGMWTIPGSVVVAFAFQVLEGVGRNIQDPFDGTIHDTPMAALCRTIERDLRHALGEADLPEPLLPQNGVLM